MEGFVVEECFQKDVEDQKRPQFGLNFSSSLRNLMSKDTINICTQHSIFSRDYNKQCTLFMSSLQFRL